MLRLRRIFLAFAILLGYCATSVSADGFCWMYYYSGGNPSTAVPTSIDCFYSNSSVQCQPLDSAHYQPVSGSDTTLYDDQITCQENKVTLPFVCYDSRTSACKRGVNLTVSPGVLPNCSSAGSGYANQTARANTDAGFTECENANLPAYYCKSATTGCYSKRGTVTSRNCGSDEGPFENPDCTSATDEQWCIFKENATGQLQCKKLTNKLTGGDNCSLAVEIGWTAVPGSIYSDETSCNTQRSSTLYYCYDEANDKCVRQNLTGTGYCPDGYHRQAYTDSDTCYNGEHVTKMIDVDIQTERLDKDLINKMKLCLFKGDIVLGGGGSDDLVLKFVRDIVFPIAAAALLLLISYAGFQMVQGATLSNQGLFDQGKKRLTAAIIGFVLLLLSYGIYSMIRSMLGFNG